MSRFSVSTLLSNMDHDLDLDFNESTGELQRKSVLLARLVRKTCHCLQGCSWVDRNIITQFCRAGTSVGANVREAQYAESRRDFIHKLKVAEKEMAETLYWFGLLSSDPNVFHSLDTTEASDLCLRVRKLLRKVILSARDKM